MAIPGKVWRWGALGGLWTLVGVIVWLVVIQVILIFFSPFGTWQRPGIARVRVIAVEKDPLSLFTDNIQVLQGGAKRSLNMLKTERVQLRVGDEIWILDNYYMTGTRPGQFRLTPWRLLLEYPEPPADPGAAGHLAPAPGPSRGSRSGGPGGSDSAADGPGG